MSTTLNTNQNYYPTPIKKKSNSTLQAADKGIKTVTGKRHKPAARRVLKPYVLKQIKELNSAEENQEYNEKYNQFINQYINNGTPQIDLCIKALDFFPSTRNKEILKIIKNYIQSLPGMMDILLRERNKAKFEKTFGQILLSIQHEFHESNKFICKYGEYGEKFYIIMK